MTSFLEKIAETNNSKNKGTSLLMHQLGDYMLNIENGLNLTFNESNSRLNFNDLSKALESTKTDDIKDFQVLSLLEHSVKLKATRAVELFVLLQKKVSLEKHFSKTDGLLKERLEFYFRVKSWQSLYKDCKPPLSKIVSKQKNVMAFR